MVSLFILSVFHENNKRKETIIVIVCLECEGEKNFFLVKKSKLKRNFLAGCSAAKIYAGWEKFSSVIFLKILNIFPLDCKIYFLKQFFLHFYDKKNFLFAFAI